MRSELYTERKILVHHKNIMLRETFLFELKLFFGLVLDFWL